VYERWIRTVLRFRIAVVLAWLAVAGAGIYAATSLPPLLSNSFAVPGTDSDRARLILQHRYGERPEGTFTVVFQVKRPSDRGLRRELRRRLLGVSAVVPGGQVGPLRAGGGVLYADIGSTLDLRRAKAYTDDLRAELWTRSGPPVLVTGQPAIQHDLDPVIASDLHRAEAIAVPVALLILFLTLGISWAVAVPFLFAAGTITGSLLVVYGLAHEVSMVTWVTSLVELIGLGLAIDYSLLIVLRLREELESAGDAQAAVVRAMSTAGRAIVFSGLAVAAGLALLLFMPVPFIRSMGVAGLVIPLVSIVAALTLQPALLSLFGRRGLRRLEVGVRLPTFPWGRLGAWVVRRRVIVLVLSCAVLVGAALPAFALGLTPGSISGIPHSLESVRGFDLLRKRVAAGAVTPTEVVIDAGSRAATHTAANRLVGALFHDPEVLLVAGGPSMPYVDPSGRYSRVFAINRHVYSAAPTRRFVDRLRETIVPALELPPGARTYAGGIPAQGVDFLDRAYGAFPWLSVAVLLVTFLILLRAFRSIVLPLKAVVLNVLTVAAVYGLLEVVFGEVDGWVPIFLFATLFGLSMDYEVFLVSRVREFWLDTGDNKLAVTRGVERTGRVITAAAAIMAVAFSGFVFGRVEALRQFGLGLVLAVVIDATIVRTFLAPAFMAVVDRYNWWLPHRKRGPEAPPPSEIVA
jgi:putative drug exporter of the RND superfamily